ncbi:hypothetical protein FY034_00090 [Trichlorobacter lovleyi]|uniref:hypothetical protein n=1 Tax=Trichlorobacter lovleyi TaxID=313985 RepID=UPI00224068D5|nr:hypothetical protein [Trichlorobacter lovleyi]QOX77406.1 hypothetical protein FY034_00090 [Trichlorobacter lovleyi]
MQITYENKAEDILALYNRTFNGPDDIVGLSKHTADDASITSRPERFFSAVRYPSWGFGGAIIGCFFGYSSVVERISVLILLSLLLAGWAWWNYRQYPNKLAQKQIEKDPLSIGKRTLTISPEGLELQTAGSNTFKTWNEVWHAELLQEYIFVATFGQILIISLRELGDELFKNTWGEIQLCRKNHDLKACRA